MTTISRRLLAILCGVLFLIGTIHAQVTQTITLNDAVRIALEQNVQLKLSANQVRQQENNLQGARSFMYPTLNLGTNAGRSYGLSFDQTTGRVVNFSTDRMGFNASTGLTLFSGFRDWAALKQSKMSVEGTELDYERQRQTVVFQVMDQYLLLVQAQSQVTIQEENLSAQLQLLAQIQEFVDAGSRPVSDLYQQQASAANAELSLLNAQRDVESAENRLIQTLQLDPFRGYIFEVPDLTARALVPEEYNVEELVRTAFDRRLDLRAQEITIGVMEQQVRIARSARYPRLSFSAGIGTNYSSVQGIFGGQTVPFGDQLKNNRSESIGLNLSIPILNGFTTRTSVQSAQISHNNARLTLDNLRQSIRLDVRQAHLDYLRDVKYLDVTDKQLLSAEQALEAAQERYNVGASTLVELAQVQASHLAAAMTRASAVNSFFFRKLLIDFYVGILDPSQPLFD